MTDQELFQILYKRYGKLEINLSEACNYKEFGMSYSKASKMLGNGEGSIPKIVILEKNILPKWTKTERQQRSWKLINIAKWQLDTESSENGS